MLGHSEGVRGALALGGEGGYPARLPGHCWFLDSVRARFSLSNTQTVLISLPCHSLLRGSSPEVMHIFIGRGYSIEGRGRRWIYWHRYFLLGQQSLTFSAPGTDFIEDNFPTDWGRLDGFQMILLRTMESKSLTRAVHSRVRASVRV